MSTTPWMTAQEFNRKEFQKYIEYEVKPAPVPAPAGYKKAKYEFVKHEFELTSEQMALSKKQVAAQFAATTNEIVPGGPMLKAIDASLFIKGGTQMLNGRGGNMRIQDTYNHALRHRSAQFQESMRLGMHSEIHQSGRYSGEDVQMIGTDENGQQGKVGKCVDGSSDSGTFLITWSDGKESFCNGDELMPAILVNQGWTNQYVWTLVPVIEEVLAKGGVRCCFSTSQDLLNLMDAVQGNYEASLAVFQQCYGDVIGDEHTASFQELQQISTELPKGKPSQPKDDVKDAETLYKAAIVTRDSFENKLNDLALKTSTEPHMGPIKRIFRATEKVTANYGGDWCQLTDVVRGSLYCNDLAAVVKCVRGVMADNDVDILRHKNKFCDSAKMGYRDFSMLVRIQDVATSGTLGGRHVCELQVHLKSYVAVKGSGAHKCYAQARAFALA